jgi:hypothetical protein
MLAGKATHNNTSEEKLFLFRAKILMKILDLNDQSTMSMLAEIHMEWAAKENE